MNNIFHILGCNSNIDLAYTVGNDVSGLDVDLYRNSNTPPIESLLTSSSNAYEDRMILNTSSNITSPNYSKTGQGNKNFSNMILSEANNPDCDGIKRRKLSASPVSYSQYRAKRLVNIFLFENVYSI